MNIYHLKRKDAAPFSGYEEAVVSAESNRQARKLAQKHLNPYGDNVSFPSDDQLDCCPIGLSTLDKMVVMWRGTLEISGVHANTIGEGHK